MRNTVELFRLPKFEVREEGAQIYKELISFKVNLPTKCTIKRFILLPEPKDSLNSQAPYLVLEVSPPVDSFLPTVFHALADGCEILPNTEYIGTFDTVYTHENQYVIDPPVRYHLYRQKTRKPRAIKAVDAAHNLKTDQAPKT